jgi:DNA-binding winged helix-turn-helix (wHTH) protein/tetratricopeptide (TPR) repeat protein
MNETQSSAGIPEPIEVSREPEFTLGSLKVRPPLLEVSATGLRQTLQLRVMQVLIALARRTGEVVSRDELIATCWDSRTVGDDAINRCIAQLRRLSEQDPSRSFSIETIARVGYRLSVASVAVPVPDTQRPSIREAQPLERAFRLGWKVWSGLTITGVVAVVAIGFFATRDRSPANIRAVGVIRLEGYRAEESALSASLSDKLLNALTLEGLSPIVLSGSGDATHRGVPLVVGGGVERHPPSVSVHTRLDDAATGTTLWSQDFAGSADEPASVLTEAAMATAGAATLGQVCSDGPVSVVASCVQIGMMIRDNDFARAHVRAEQLAAVRPESALAQLWLASAAAGETLLPGTSERATLLAQAEAAARRTLALDPRLADAYRILAQTIPRRRWADREALIRRALTPSLQSGALFEANANASLGRLLIDAGRPQEAAHYVQRATTLDPLSATKAVIAVAGLETSGRLAEAKRLLEDCVRSWPHDGAVRLYERYFRILYGPPDEARAVIDSPEAPFPFPDAAKEALRSFVAGHSTHDPDMRARASRQLSGVAMSHELDLRLAVPALASLGDVDAAFSFAEQYLADERAETTFLFAPGTAPLRMDPRFMSLADRAGLSAYWRSSGKWPDFCAVLQAPYDCRQPDSRR